MSCFSLTFASFLKQRSSSLRVRSLERYRGVGKSLVGSQGFKEAISRSLIPGVKGEDAMYQGRLWGSCQVIRRSVKDESQGHPLNGSCYPFGSENETEADAFIWSIQRQMLPFSLHSAKLLKYSSTMPLRGSGELLKNQMGVQQVQAGNCWSFSEVTEDSSHIQLDSVDSNKPVCLRDITVGDSLRNGWLRTNASAVCPGLALLREAFQVRALAVHHLTEGLLGLFQQVDSVT